MAMTKKLRAELLSILSDAERAQAFIVSERIAVCRVEDNATTTLHYTRAFVPGIDKPGDAKPLYRIAKDIGSDLCRLPNAIRHMKRLTETQ